MSKNERAVGGERKIRSARRRLDPTGVVEEQAAAGGSPSPTSSPASHAAFEVAAGWPGSSASAKE
jgi:hypothetical protein